MDQYQKTMLYGGAGWAIGKYMVSWTPTPRISPEMFWGLAGAGLGYLHDSKAAEENSTRNDNPTFNFSTPYQGVA